MRSPNVKHSALIVSSLLLFAFVAGCDYSGRRATEAERADRLYQTAMAEYAAGRLDKSVEGFEKVLRVNPGNASARFQLACLLQDHKKDPLGAICNYREYMALFPKGDKVRIAEERAAACERQLAVLLAKKHNLGGSVAQDEANARLKGDNAKLTAELEKARQDNEKLKADLSALRRENERVRRMMLAGGEEESEEGKVKSEKVRTDSASESAAKKMPVIPDEKELDENEAAGVDRVKMSADIANLIAEEKEETEQALPFGKTVRKAEEPKKNAVPEEPPHEPRPETYVVQDGDTLFKIAIRFYGRRSAWSSIRDANKATVSSDGRIKVGQALKLP